MFLNTFHREHILLKLKIKKSLRKIRSKNLSAEVFFFSKNNILRKTIEGYQNSFDFITFGNIVFKQIIFVIDRIITLQFTKMQIEIHGSLVTIQYYTKCTDPLYLKFTSKKFSALNFR